MYHLQAIPLMKKIYLLPVAMITGVISTSAAETPGQPTNLEAGLRIVEAHYGYMIHPQTQHLLGIEEGEPIDGFSTLNLVGCDIATGAVGSTRATVRTEGSKVYLYFPEAEENEAKWELIYDFNPTVGEVFSVVGYPTERRERYRCCCREVNESDPEFGGMKTLTMAFTTYDTYDGSRDWIESDRGEKWIVGVGDQYGLLDSGYSGWVGTGGSSIIAAYNGDDTYFTSRAVRNYRNYITYGIDFNQQWNGENFSMQIGGPHDSDDHKYTRSPIVSVPDESAPSGMRDIGGIYASDQKICFTLLPDNDRRIQWYDIYDFSLEPGEKARLTRVKFNPFSDAQVMPSVEPVEVECISVEPYEHDPSFIAMHMMAYSLAGPKPGDREILAPVTWIKGIGSLAGLLNNCPSAAYPSPALSSVIESGTEVFNNPSADIREVTATPAPSSAPTEIFDLSGRRVLASPDALPAGIYILRSGTETRKIAVR